MCVIKYLFLWALVYTASGKVCPEGFERLIYDQEKCIRHVKIEMYFDEADKYCKSLGGNLLKVNDPQTAVFTLAPNGYGYIGLRKDKTFKYSWTVDNSPLKFRNWARREPKRWKGCVIASPFTTKWYSVTCNRTKHWSFCEHPGNKKAPAELQSQPVMT